MRFLNYFFILQLFSLYSLASIILSEQFNTQPNYFSVYHENEGGTNTQLETSVSNGVLNILTDGQSQDIEIEMSYPVSSSDAENGILYFTAEVGNSAEVTDGGTFIDSDGDIEAINQAVAWLTLNNFNGSVDEIALQNHNGVKRITYGDNDNYFNVSDFDKMYLRLSYDFNSNILKQYYSTDGINFTEIFSSYAWDESFSVSIGAESNNVTFNQGEVYFDNFVISGDSAYNSSSDTNTIILKTYKSNDMQNWELIESKEIQSEDTFFLKSEIVTE